MPVLNADMFDHLEKRLIQLQETGFIASGYFGRGTLYAHQVAAAPEAKGYITFDSTGTDSTLWQASQGETKIQATVLSQWQRTPAGVLLSSKRWGPLSHSQERGPG